MLTRNTTLAEDRCRPALMIVALAGLALGCLASLAFVALFPFPVVAPPSSGVVGWVTVHGYPKSRESLYFAVIVALILVSEAACVASWIRMTRLAAARATDSIRAAHLHALACLPLFVGFAVAVIKPTGVPTTLLATVLAFAAAQGALLFGFFSAGEVGDSPRDLAVLPHTDGSGAADEEPRLFGRARAWPAATVAFAGCVFGWFLPMAVGSQGRKLASLWWGWPAVAVAAWIAVAALLRHRRDRGGADIRARGALPLMPLLALSIVPFLIDFPGARRVVLLVVLSAVALLLGALLVRKRGGLGREAAVVRVCGMGGLVITAMAWVWQPDFPGIWVFPGDGDHLAAFVNDGLHGKVLYRDFWYPYGPLFFLLELWSARVAGLDHYYVPAWLVTTALGTVGLCLTARRVFLTWPFQAAGTLALFLLWPPQTVQFRVYAGYLTAVAATAAAASGRPRVLGLAGLMAAVAFLFSHETAIAAIAGAQLGFLWSARAATFRETARTYALRVYPFLGGLATALALAALAAAATGTLLPYLRSAFGFVSVNDACCGMPFPNLRDELATAGQPLSVRLRHVGRFLFLSDVFRYFYLPLLVYLALLFHVVLRALGGARPLRQDAVLMGVAGFGFILYRLALGRSDTIHARFAAVPAIVLGWALLERAALRVLGNLRRGRRPWRWPVAAQVETAMLSAGAVFLGWGLQLPVLPAALREVTRRLSLYHELRHEPRPATGTVFSVRGGRFYFGEAVAPMVQETFDYLRANTGPEEAVYAFPYAFRYNVLLDRASPLKFGSCIWGAAARPSDQRRLIAELDATRVRYIVYDESEWPDMDSVPTGDRFAELADFIFGRYAPERRIGPTVVLRLRESQPPSPPTVLDVGLDEHRAFLHRGWYYPWREPGPSGPELMRWTSTTATARVTRPAGAGELFIDAMVYVPEGARRRWLTASVDGVALGRIDLSTLQGRVTLRFPLTTSSARDEPAVVRIDVDPFPARSDNRFLGLLVKQVGLR